MTDIAKEYRRGDPLAVAEIIKSKVHFILHAEKWSSRTVLDLVYTEKLALLRL